MTLQSLLLVLSLFSANESSPKLSGGFIQYSDTPKQSTKDLTVQQWHSVGKAMADIGLTTVIVQGLEYQEGKTVTSFIPESGVDATDVLLSYAHEHGMKVFVGLRVVEEWDEIRKDEKRRMALLADNQTLATNIWNKYGRHPSFAGWYLPQELANYGYCDNELTDLQDYFDRLSKHCATVGKGKAVAVSPYFNPCLADPTRFASDMKQILGDTSVTVIMLQDGVGERQIDKLAIEEKVSPFFEQMRKNCGPHQELWANLECFQRQKENRSPLRDFERFKLQFAATKEFTSVFVTFDFFHYMNPLGYTHEGTPGYVEAEKELYKAYKKEFGK